MEAPPGRTMGLLGATGVGIGAIVGGGILALAGVAFAMTGPGAMVAFALNGAIAVLTALSFAEMSSAFPESGGTYTFARKVLSVRTAFMVGWVVWFASIVAAVLYALGFGSYAMAAIGHIRHEPWMDSRWCVAALAAGATGVYTLGLVRKAAGGGQWATVGKVVVFAILIGGGFWALPGRSRTEIGEGLTPFFPGGTLGLVQAMGYTFIALQGFDLIAAVAGEIREPHRTIPRAMFLSLGSALAIYLPFLFVIATVGVAPGQDVAALGERHSETLVPLAVRNFLGPVGYWLVLVAAVLSMLSALQANLFAASRVVQAMGRDRTLPVRLAGVHPRRRTPVPGILASALMIAVILVFLSDVAAAGAASSLIFLISFATVHWMTILARRRGSALQGGFRTPLFPLVPVAGALCCVGLAVFQGIAVPSAGIVAAIWLGIGGALFLSLFARRALVVDASAEARDPTLVQMRGRRPLVLVPMANPANAESMVAVAQALAPPRVGRVLLLTVVNPPDHWEKGSVPPQLVDAQTVLREALTASFSEGLQPEALTTVAPLPWREIARVARAYGCESLLLGFGNQVGLRTERLIGRVDCDVVVLRARHGWRMADARRILVPVGGRGLQDVLRARILGSAWRMGEREVTFLRVLKEEAAAAEAARARAALERLAQDEVPGPASLEVIRGDDPAAEITRRAEGMDLLILGMQRVSRRQKAFGPVTLRILEETECPVIMISRRH